MDHVINMLFTPKLLTVFLPSFHQRVYSEVKGQICASLLVISLYVELPWERLIYYKQLISLEGFKGSEAPLRLCAVVVFTLSP